MLAILTTGIYDNYKRIMEGEISIRPEHQPEGVLGKKQSVLELDEDILQTGMQLLEIAQAATVSRSYNSSYNLCTDEFIYESVSAHTNLVSAIMTAALDYHYGYQFGDPEHGQTLTVDGYSYREIMEAVQVHDLAENETGDQADNGARDEERKKLVEWRLVSGYLDRSPMWKEDLRLKIRKLFSELQDLSSPTGRMIYLSDKIAALIITLCLDALGHPPVMMSGSSLASERDRLEMELCESSQDDFYKASEMWATDFFEIRKMVNMDESFFFTALIVMCTLMVKRRWYSWREAKYC